MSIRNAGVSLTVSAKNLAFFKILCIAFLIVTPSNSEKIVLSYAVCLETEFN